MLDLVKEALSDTQESQKNAIEFLCGVETNFWAKTILTKEEQDKLQHQSQEEKALQKRIEELKEEITDLDPSQTALILQKNKELQEIEKDIESKQFKNLPQILEKKTRELLDRSQQSVRLISPNPMEIVSTTTSELFRFSRSRT